MCRPSVYVSGVLFAKLRCLSARVSGMSVYFKQSTKKNGDVFFTENNGSVYSYLKRITVLYIQLSIFFCSPLNY